MQSQQTKAQTSLKRFNLLGGLELKHAKSSEHVYAKHMHEEYSLCLMHEGISAIEYRGSKYYSGPLSISIMNPAEVHACYGENGKSMTYSMLYPTTQALNQTCQDLLSKAQTPYFQEPIIQDNALSLNLKQFLNEKEGLAQESLYLDVLSNLITRYSDSKLQLQQVGKEHRAVAQIKQFLQEHYKESISLKQLSQLTQLNQSYLTRVFRKEVGIAPHAYQNNLRLLNAKHLLPHNDITSVALELGFADQSHLTRLFKRAFGVTPGQYIKSKPK